MGIFTTSNMRNVMTSQQADEIIKNQKEIKNLLKQYKSKTNVTDSQIMDMIGNVSDKLDRMYPEESEPTDYL